MKIKRGTTRKDGYRFNGYASSGKEHWLSPEVFEAINLNHQVLRWKNKLKVFQAYGNKCKICEENDPLVLNIDHIFDDGKSHKRLGGTRVTGNSLYSHLIKNKFPKDRFQLLCANCNQRKEWIRRGAYYEDTSCN
jgi:hypothetical protein